MKKAFTLVAVLFMVSILMAGVPVAVASGNEFSGIMYLIPDQDKPGQTYYTDSGFVVTIGAGVYGPIWTSDPRTSGTMFINLNVVVNMDTGKGFGFGAFQLASDLGSTFRGTFGLSYKGYVPLNYEPYVGLVFEGTLVGRGTGDFSGMRLYMAFTGVEGSIDPIICNGYIIP